MRRKIPTLKTASLSPRNNKKKKHPEFILQDQDQDWDQGQNQSFLQRDRQIKSLCVTKTSASIYIVVQIEDTSQATGYSSQLLAIWQHFVFQQTNSGQGSSSSIGQLDKLPTHCWHQSVKYKINNPANCCQLVTQHGLRQFVSLARLVTGNLTAQITKRTLMQMPHTKLDLTVAVISQLAGHCNCEHIQLCISKTLTEVLPSCIRSHCCCLPPERFIAITEISQPTKIAQNIRLAIHLCFTICLEEQQEGEKTAKLVNQTHKLTPGRKLDLRPLVRNDITSCADIYMQQDKELGGRRRRARQGWIQSGAWLGVRTCEGILRCFLIGLVCCSEVEFLGSIGNGNKRFSLYYISVQIDIYTTQTYILSTDYVL